MRAELAAHLESDTQEYFWRDVAQEAAESELEIEARAWDKIGVLTAEGGDSLQAWNYFQKADEVAPMRERSATLWRVYVEVVAEINNQAVARDVVDRALLSIDEQHDPDLAADLHDARAALDADANDFKSAYLSLRSAQQIRERPQSIDLVPMARMTTLSSVTKEEEAAELAVVRSALREAKLDAARLKQRNAFVLVVASLLLAGLLGAAYHFKRRAAEALAEAKDAAKLRAERTHWEMLRYQLNPHFLFNALTSISGLALVNPQATRKTVGRLSQFCRLALERTTGQLRSVKAEVDLLSAYLDVEKVGMGERLEVEFFTNPEVSDWLLPPLLLQPLVENALKYGSQTSGDLLQIKVSIELDKTTGGLSVEIANTGEWVKTADSKQRRRKIGLTNVRERLHHIAPDSAKLTSDSGDGWVTVRIDLPDLRDHALAAPAIF